MINNVIFFKNFPIFHRFFICILPVSTGDHQDIPEYINECLKFMSSDLNCCIYSLFMILCILFSLLLSLLLITSYISANIFLFLRIYSSLLPPHPSALSSNEDNCLSLPIIYPSLLLSNSNYDVFMKKSAFS